MPPRRRAARRVAEVGDRGAGRTITPSLRRGTEPLLPELYEQGRRRAVAGLREFKERNAARPLPESCPYSLDDTCRHDRYPPSRRGLSDDGAEA